MGWRAKASLRVLPPSTSSQTVSRMVLSFPGFCWLSRIWSDRRSGRPASWSVESWRVKSTRRLSGTPPKERLKPPFFFFFLSGATFGLAAPLPFCSRTVVG